MERKYTVNFDFLQKSNCWSGDPICTKYQKNILKKIKSADIIA